MPKPNRLPLSVSTVSSVSVLVFLLLTCFMPVSRAEADPKHPKKGDSLTVTINASTILTVNGQDAKPVDLANGMQVKVIEMSDPDNPQVATKIEAFRVQPLPKNVPENPHAMTWYIEKFSDTSLTVTGGVVHTRVDNS